MAIQFTAIPAALALATLLVLGSAPAAQAQPATPQLSQAQPPKDGNVSDESLQAYAMAVLEINRIQTDMQPQIDGAGSQQEAEQLRRQARDQMVEAIQDQGLSIEQYNEINTMARQDTEVRAAILEHMQNAQ